MDNKSFESLKIILLACLAVWLIAVVVIIMIFLLIIKFYLDVDDDIKIWLCIGYSVGGSIEILIFLFGIFPVHHQHYGCSIGFILIQILNLIIFSFLIRHCVSGLFFALLTLGFLIELIIVILCILYAIQLENENKIFLCIKSVLLTWFSIHLILTTVFLIFAYINLFLSILRNLRAGFIQSFIYILILIGFIKAINYENYYGCIAINIYHILKLIYMYYFIINDLFDVVDKILIISPEIIVIVLCIRYTYHIRRRQINN